MRRVALVAADSGTELVAPCELANRPWTRLRGLLGRRGLSPGHGMLFSRTHAVHTAFMRFPIDVVFLDSELEVTHVAADVAPWRTARGKGASWTLELAAGEAARVGLEPGRRVVIDGG